MAKDDSGFRTIDEYIARFPQPIQVRLEAIRATIHQSGAGIDERISYQMPAFATTENLVYFGAYERHIGFYPTSSGIAAFAKEFAPYKSSKGAVQFPHDQPLPLELIAQVVRFRLAEAADRAAIKSRSKKK